MSDADGNSFVYLRVLMFSETKPRETSGLEAKQNYLVSRGTSDIKCFVIFLDFHFNSDKRITGANQNSRLSTYSNTNLILKTTE